MKYSCIILSIILISANCISQNKWFDDQSIGATVLLEKSVNGSLQPHGVGILVYNYDKPDQPIVITCKHILLNSDIYVVINADSAYINFAKREGHNGIQFKKGIWKLEKVKLIKKFPLRLGKNPTYAIHDSLDIGAFPIDLVSGVRDSTGKELMKFNHVIRYSNSFIGGNKLLKLGTEVYFTGFPFEIGTSTISPLVRSGSIAWMSPESKEFYLDAFSYSGNSGSPLFTKGQMDTTNMFLKIEQPQLIGMVIGHLGDSIQNVLFQPDTSKPELARTIQENNWGLARCLYIDDIIPVIERAKKCEISE
jgi:hypothetical protein